MSAPPESEAQRLVNNPKRRVDSREEHDSGTNRPLALRKRPRVSEDTDPPAVSLWTPKITEKSTLAQQRHDEVMRKLESLSPSHDATTLEAVKNDILHEMTAQIDQIKNHVDKALQADNEAVEKVTQNMGGVKDVLDVVASQQNTVMEHLNDHHTEVDRLRKEVEGYQNKVRERDDIILNYKIAQRTGPDQVADYKLAYQQMKDQRYAAVQAQRQAEAQRDEAVEGQMTAEASAADEKQRREAAEAAKDTALAEQRQAESRAADAEAQAAKAQAELTKTWNLVHEVEKDLTLALTDAKMYYEVVIDHGDRCPGILEELDTKIAER